MAQTEYRCWHCDAIIASRRARFCSRCGVIAPANGLSRLARMGQRYQQAEPYYHAWMTVRVIIKAEAVLAVFLASVWNVLSPAIIIPVLFAMVVLIGRAIWLCMMQATARRRFRAYHARVKQLNTLHPAALPENVLLRPTSHVPTDPLVRPAGGQTAPEVEHLLRPSGEDEAG